MPTVPSVSGELSDDEVFGTPVEKAAPAIETPAPTPAANDTAPAGEMSDREVFGPAVADLKVRVREAARQGAGVTPDAVLEAEALGARYGIPADIARRNADELKRRAEVDDFAALVDTNPKLAAWFAEDADAAVVAKPDIENLSWLEKKLGIEAPLRGTAAGDALQGYADVLGSVPQGIGQPLGQAVSGVGGLIDAGARQIDRGVRWVAGDDIADMFWFDGPRYANPSNILQDVGEGIEAGTSVLAPPEERQNLATDVASGLGQVATYATITALTGGAGGLVLGAGQGADIQADRAREAGTYGTGGADAALVGGAAITSVTERLGLNWLFRRLPAGVQKSLQKRVTDILMAGAGEAAQEVTEGVAQDALTKALVDSDYEMFAGLDREALTAGGVGLIVRSMLHLGKGRVDAEQAKTERDQIAEVGKVVDGMALAEQDPGRLRAALARLKSAGWQDVWVPVKEWQTLFQSPQESDAARKAAGVSDADYTAALLSGGKLRVPTEGFYTGLTPEQRKPLYEHARRSPEGMSPTEADQYDPEVALGEIMAEFGVEGRPAGDPSNAVYDDMRLQLERAGASPDVASAQAEQFAAFVRTMQARSGVAIDTNRLQVIAQMDPRLQAVLRGKNAEPALDSLIAAVRSNREFTEAEIMGDRLVSGLVRAGGINPESVGGGDLRAMDARYRPGLLNLGGMTMDEAVTWARENGFIDQPLSNEGDVYNPDAPDINTLLEMISGDLSGVAKAYVRDDMNVDRQAFNAGVAALREELEAKGITDERLAEMSDAEVREALGFGAEVEGEVYQQGGDVRDLIATHNLSPEKLMHALRIGGLAVPSLAITKGDSSLTGFGDITLIGDRDLVDPRAGAKAFGADIYSPRYPQVSFKVDAPAVKRLLEILKPYREAGERVYVDTNDAAEWLRSDDAFRKYLAATDKDGEKYPDLRAGAEKLLREVGAQERIFDGFTNSGNRRYKPHNLETVVKILKKELRGGEGFNYGVGSLRAKYTPQFRSVDQIKKNKGRLVSADAFAEIKKEIDEEFFAIVEALRQYAPQAREYGFADTVINVMEDAAKIGVPRALADYGIKDVPAEVQREVAEFLGKLRDLPTEYFEVKQLRSVGVGEFRAAAVPTGTPKEVTDALRDRGLEVVEYERGNDSARREAVKQVAQAQNVLFQSAQPAGIDLTPSPASRRIKTGDTTLTYSVDEAGAKIILVRTPKDKRGQGGARRAMQEFLTAADAAGIPVSLTVAEQDSTTDADRLREFYSSLGFVAGEGDSMSRPAVRPGERDTVVEAPEGFIAKPIKPPQPGERWFHGRLEAGERTFAAGRPAFFARDKEGAEWYAQGGGAVTDHSVNAATPARVRDLQDALVRLGYGTDPAADERLADAIAANSQYDGTNLTDAIYIPEVRAELERAGYDSLLLHDTIESGSTEALIVWDAGKIDAASDAASASDVTQSAAFKAWFQNSAAVEDGKPLRLYHGSNAPIETVMNADEVMADFDQRVKGLGVPQAYRNALEPEAGAMWFTDSEGVAEGYAGQREGVETVTEVYLSIQNPLDLREMELGEVQELLSKATGRSIEVRNDYGERKGVAQAIVKVRGALIQYARANGYDGLIYPDTDVRGAGTHTSYVTFSPGQIKSATGNRGTFDPNDPSILNQKADGTPRGSLTIAPSRYPGGARQFVIKLGEKRDFSTFLHESAHFYLEILREIDAELRARPAADLTPDQQRVLADHDALLGQLGVPDFDSIGVDQHEAFAETYEAYLREGKAPSVRLTRAFQKFGAWLKMVYRTLRGLPNQRLNDETRAIFDRMLATDDEIDAARQAQSLGAMFDTPEAAGMTPEEFAQYQEALRVARDSAIQDEAAEQYRYELAETRRWQTEEMARIRAEVTPIVDSNPAMRAKYLLRRGTLPDGSPLPPGQSPIKLDTAAVTDKYGKEWVKRNLAFMVAKGGAHPDLAAPVLGFKNGEELITALANTPNRQEAIKAEADQVWRDRHPDPMLDGATVDRVQARVHNDAQAQVMIREINALNARAGRPEGKPTVLATMKQAAERIVAGQRVGSLNPNQHRQAEAKAGRDALKAAAAGKWDEAVSARRRQLFSGLMYRASLDARERAEDVRAKMVKLAKKPAQERFAKAGWESYLDRVNDILHAFDVRRLSEKQLARRRSMRAWVEAQQEAGDVTAISEELIARVESQSVQNWRDATVAELDAAGDALVNIEHLARLKNKLVAGARAAEKDAAIDEMVARAEESLPDVMVRPVSGADLTTPARVGRTLAAKRDEVTRPENFIEALDGGVSGPWHDFVWSAMDSAEAKMQGLRKEIGARLKALRTAMPKEVMQGLGAPVTVFGIPTTRASLIGAVLNTGNAGNLQRLKDGGIAFNDQRLRLTDAQIEALRGQLTAAELRYVQGLWTTVNSLWGDIVTLQRQMSGLPPEKVEAREFTVTSADGETLTLEGGYWPLAYDRDRSAVGENQSADDALRQMMGQGFTKAATPKGYQKARVAEFEAPLQLDFGAVMSRHLDQVMTDIAYRGAVRDVMGLLNDQRIKDTVLARLGRPAYDSLRGMVSYSVSGSSAVAGAAARGWQTLADGILSNMTVSALAIRPDIALGNYASALVQGLDRSGLRALLRGLWRTYTPGRGDMTAEIKALSPFMAERLTDTDYLYTRELGRTRRERGLGPAYKRIVLTLHRTADHEVTRALWWGKYQSEIDAGATQAEAVRLADKAIRQTQTATGRKDLSTFERDPAFRQSRQFMGPMFVIFGRMAAAARGQGATQAAGARLSTAMLQVFMAPALFALMAGRWPEEDGDDEDDEIGLNEWSMWLAANTLLFPLQTLPFLRDVGSGIESALTGNPINPRAAPVSAAGANMIKAGDSIWSSIEDYQDTGEVDYYEMTRDLTTLAAPLTGAPASQVRNTTRAIEAMRDNPDSGAVEMATMAVYGKPPPIQ